MARPIWSGPPCHATGPKGLAGLYHHLTKATARFDAKLLRWALTKEQWDVGGGKEDEEELLLCRLPQQPTLPYSQILNSPEV